MFLCVRARECSAAVPVLWPLVWTRDWAIVVHSQRGQRGPSSVGSTAQLFAQLWLCSRPRQRQWPRRRRVFESLCSARRRRPSLSLFHHHSSFNSHTHSCIHTTFLSLPTSIHFHLAPFAVVQIDLGLPLSLSPPSPCPAPPPPGSGPPTPWSPLCQPWSPPPPPPPPLPAHRLDAPPATAAAPTDRVRAPPFLARVDQRTPRRPSRHTGSRVFDQKKEPDIVQAFTITPSSPYLHGLASCHQIHFHPPTHHHRYPLFPAQPARLIRPGPRLHTHPPTPAPSHPLNHRNGIDSSTTSTSTRTHTVPISRHLRTRRRRCTTSDHHRDPPTNCDCRRPRPPRIRLEQRRRQRERRPIWTPSSPEHARSCPRARTP